MEQKDYLTRQIEQMALVLRKLIGRLLNADDPTSLENEQESPFQELETALNTDFHALIELSNEDFLDKLLNEHHYTTAHLEALAEINLLLVTKNERSDRKNLIDKALFIYAFLEKKEAIYSSKRQQKIAILQELKLLNE